MAEVVGLLAAAVLKAAAGKVAAAAADRVMRQWKFDQDLKHMRDTLISIEAVLDDAERRSIEDASARQWLKRLTGACYDISDMLDEFEVKATRKSALRKFKVLKPCITLYSEVGMAGKMKKVREKLENISKQHRDFSFTAGNSFCAQQVIDGRETSSELIEADIVGRGQEKQNVMTLLNKPNNSSEFTVLPIYGIGGIGKTTLAQLLFNDTHFKDYKKAWVYVSQTFDSKKIVDSIRSQLQNVTNTQEPHADPPAGEKIMIVLDDLWENNDFKIDDLKRSIKTVCNGCKVHVIVTTRDAGIAQKIQTIEAYAIEPLSPDMCWSIIKQIVGFENRADKERLEDTGKEIAMKCEGVALAARALGYILRSRNIHEWVTLKESAVWNVSMPGYTPSPYDNVLSSLKLSYISMLRFLRPCFAYCAIFPKGHKMSKDDLIYQWAALGFIQPSNEVSILQHGENYVKQLLGMSFLQHSKSPSTDEQHQEDVTLVIMHDLVHDLARSIMGDEILDASSRKCNIERSNCHYVSLTDCTEPLNSFVTYPDKIRALHYLGSGEIGRDTAGFSTAKFLRVLNLGECCIQKLPSSICQLKQLRHLNAPGIKDVMIPNCITKLSKLIYLNLRGSSGLLALPESIGEMQDLMYLDLSGCSEIGELPKSFGNLKNLVHVDFSDCSCVVGVPASLVNLTQLQYLNLSHCEGLEELPWSLGKLTNLVHLDLSRRRTCHEYQRPLLGLSEVISKLNELRHLNLSGCVDSEDGQISDRIDSFLGNISTLSDLEHLDLSNNFCVRAIPESFRSLKKLHTLNLSGCYDLVTLPESIGQMDRLKFLIVKDCGCLNMSPLRGAKSLILLPKFVVNAAEGKQNSNIFLLKDVSPPELEISRLENVRSIEEIQMIKLREKQSMVNLTLDWTGGNERYVEDMELLEVIVPPSSLTTFELRNYNGVSYPAWIMDIAIYLPNLVTIGLWYLPQCSSLPPLGQLPNLQYLKLMAMPCITKIDRSFCGSSVKAFARLVTFSMYHMENLEEWSTAYSCGEGGADEFMFPNLEDLTICKCHKLRLHPFPPRVKGTWRLDNCDDVLLRCGDHTGSSASSPLVGCLLVESSTAPMHQWKLLHCLPALNELNIRGCHDLNSSPDISGALGSLRKLTLHGCESMTSLPQWLGDLTSLQNLRIQYCRILNYVPASFGDLVSLKNLNIVGCEGIVSLPESIQQLTNLERLNIFQCPALEQWFKLEENKKKISHVKEVEIGQ